MANILGTPVLHIYPGKWDLPSIDPASLASVLYLQLAIPHRFSVIECANPDESPSGQFPYLTHGNHLAAPLSTIIKYVSGLSPNSLPVQDESGAEQIFSTNLDALLSPVERAQRTAWCAHILTTLGDLVAHNFYSVPTNYTGVTHPALISFLSVPQRYYVPHRMREMHQNRLAASGLWDVDAEEVEDKEAEKKFGQKKEEKADPKKIFKETFQRERVLDRARDAFDLYSRLLGENRFFYYDRPTSIDVFLAAHILLMLKPPFPNPFLASLLESSYPTLVSHADRVLRTAFPTLAIAPAQETYKTQLHMLPPETYSIRSLLPSFTSWSANPAGLFHRRGATEEKSEEDKRFDRMRRLWIGMAALGTVGFWVLYGPRFRLVVPDEEDEEGFVEEFEEGEEEEGDGEGDE
ncbi:uncharacterized protein STEHIDRAFT_93301 [Stereum hirsutum FP-91666 SS1]|uniref:uncharacterized protein n=1 Tax=Stereum hirsutum (strain FP-91666) TaxID=721885 RepID=UPI000440B2B1|nr:uncharacterized protein STEHIDRAFT_93301 [Stereum hirsutum FP-91666 SS1]EIM90362.1 hypothetical protein STEHIDRAFT_93301 [Stereum hirsutum FP-91666 SS1]